MNAKASKKPGPSRAPSTKLWKKMWSAPVNSRIRNFLWRMAKNILPTKDNLSRKGINSDLLCPLCQTAKESVSHLFMQCVFVKQLLFSSPLSYRVPTNSDIKDWLLGFLSCGDVFSIQLLCTMLHRTWLARNSAVFNQIFQDPIRVAEDAVNGVAEHNRWNQEEKTISIAATTTKPWPKDVITIQVDAGLSPNGSIAFGGVFRDRERKIIMAASKKEEARTEPVVAEILAIRWSLGIAADLKFERIILQSDALGVVDCINGHRSIAVIDHITEDCRILLNSFSFSSVMFIPRSSNVDAHNLVVLSKRLGSRTWLGSYPMEDHVVTNSGLISAV
ncbi:uncharacterized protein LOC131630541 [Vicia villosa]|uniref:uncharacterized protein LOC131630541 n=1 Tax=Vicia villosa TaxID=3911 RepID=UPI00273AEAAB|nr:uncharacterized protein LOC131630541 [Vicia villosa]